jgi:hypothetical protein
MILGEPSETLQGFFFDCESALICFAEKTLAVTRLFIHVLKPSHPHPENAPEAFSL